MIYALSYQGTHLGIIIRKNYINEDIEFFTNENDPIQLGYMKRNKDYIIKPHVDNPIKRSINYTYEVLFIKTGIVRVDFYTEDKIYIFSKKLYQGDVILLTRGGHGFKIIEDAEIIEVKQGPYVGDLDKIRFMPIDESKIIESE